MSTTPSPDSAIARNDVVVSVVHYVARTTVLIGRLVVLDSTSPVVPAPRDPADARGSSVGSDL